MSVRTAKWFVPADICWYEWESASNVKIPSSSTGFEIKSISVSFLKIFFNFSRILSSSLKIFFPVKNILSSSVIKYE